MAERHTRNLIRVLTAAALCMALMACAVVPVPANLPAVAVRQPGLYRLEVGLMVFYGWLLLATPVFSGLIRGHLPIEISTRGARFAEETELSATLNLEKVEELERISEAHAEELTAVLVELERLRGMSEGDSTQPRVDSKP